MAGCCVLFDCDGVLLDTEPVWRRAERSVFRRWAGEATTPMPTGLAGVAVEEVARRFADRLERGRDAVRAIEKDLVTTWQQEVGTVRVLDGVEEAIAALKDRIAIGVVSNTPRELLRDLLDAARLSRAFDAIVGLSPGHRPKPAPDLYARACERLDASPRRSHAFEDSQVGVHAAAAAGLRVTGVLNAPAVLDRTDEVVSTLAGYDWESLAARLAEESSCTR
jgi:HAD superfamily hydrolase (TIGR01509 family)